MKHDGLTDFISENKEGIKRIADVITQAFELLEEFRSRDNNLYDIAVNDDRIRPILSPASISILKNNQGSESDLRGYLSMVVYGFAEENFDFVSDYTNTNFVKHGDRIHIYGNMKTGERAKLELMSDLNNSLSFDEGLARPIFNLDDHIQIGLDLSRIITNRYHGLIKIDVDALLVRYFQSEEYFNNTNEINNALYASVFNRAIMFAQGFMTLRRLITNLPFAKLMIEETQNSKYSINDTIKFLLIYKNWYNIINGLDDSDMDKSTLDILDKCEGADTLFTKANGPQQAFLILHSKLMKATMDVPRYPDQMIQKLLDMGRIANNTYIRTNNKKVENLNIISAPTGRFITSIESIGFEEILNQIGCTRESMEEIDNTKALFGMLGVESLSNKAGFDEFKKKSRGAILAKLNPKERKIYMGLESDVLRLKAEAQAVTTTSGQQNVLKKCEAVGKMLLFEMNASTNDNFVTLLSALDSERYEIQSTLSSRDIVKERNTKLYGQDITRRDWNY